MSLEKRHLVTGALLAFVVVTGVTLAVKETRHARAVAAVEASRPPEPAAPTLASEPVPAATAEVPLTAQPPVPAAAPTAAPLARTTAPRPSAPKPAAAAGPAPAPAPVVPPATVFVTYFHTTARCASCLKIEDLTNATMTTRFAGPIAEKRIVWRLVNLDEPENAHYVKDYGLYTKSVVVTEVKEGREVRWKNLDQVWQLLGDPAGFQGYVEREVQAFLDKA